MRLGGIAVGLIGVSWLPSIAAQCGGGEETPTPNPMEGEDTTVVAFQAVHQQFGDGDTRTVSTEVTFPEEEWLYDQILLHYTLSCPSGGCDPWDRLAYVQVTSDAGSADERTVEVGRFITPYGVGGSWSVDVTELRPILSGPRKVSSFIDTWVNPGWLVDVSFELRGGTPARRAVDVIPLWSGYYGYGNPDNPPDNYLLDQRAAVPATTTDAAMRVLATGHGFGATENCAEFCQKEHTLVAGAVSDTEVVWRNDCAVAGVPGQSGTFWYNRAGWCPGDDVIPRVWELGSLVTPGAETVFDYRLQDYVNYETDVSPYWVISAYLILFEG